MMSTANQTSLDHFKEFFGSDKRAQKFVAAMTSDGNFKNKQVNSPNTPQMNALMDAACHSDKGRSVESNDVPVSFTGFIQNVALWHHTLDGPQGNAVKIQGVKKFYEHFKTINTDNKFKTFIRPLCAGIDISTDDTYARSMVAIFNQTANYVLKKELLKILKENKTVIPDGQRSLSYMKTQEYTQDPTGDESDFDTYDDYFNIINNVVTFLSNKDRLEDCYGVLSSFSVLLPFLSVDDTKIVDPDKKTTYDTTMNSMKQLYAPDIVFDANTLINIVDYVTQAVTQVQPRPTQPLNPDTVIDRIPIFMKNIRDTILAALQGYGYPGIEENLTNEILLQGMRDIWRRDNQSLKDFCENYMNVLCDDNTDLKDDEKDRAKPLRAGWQALAYDDVSRIFRDDARFTVLRPHLRINLLRQGAEVRFGLDLPTIPRERLPCRVWYDTKEGPKYRETNDEKFFRKMYARVHAKGPDGFYEPDVFGPGARDNLEPDVGNVPARLKASKPFRINWHVYTQRINETLKLEIAKDAKEEEFPDGGIFNDYASYRTFDMATGRVWEYDEKGYFRMEDGKRIQYSGTAKNCFSTYLAKGDEDKCDRLLTCLLSGDRKSLKLCLDMIGEADLWDVAHQDVQRVDPQYVLKILDQFCFAYRKKTDPESGTRYMELMPFDEWKRDRLNGPNTHFEADLKATIEGNQKLLRYIKGLADVCIANPAILNKGNPKLSLRRVIPRYARQVGISRYNSPSIATIGQRNEYAAILLQTGGSAKSNFVNTQTLFKQMWALGDVQYTVPGNSVPMRGGAQPQTPESKYSSTVSALVNNTMISLRSLGMKINDKDMSRMNAAIRQIKNYEVQIVKMCRVAQRLISYAHTLGVTYNDVLNAPNGELEQMNEITDEESVRTYIKKQIKSLWSKITSGIAKQNTLTIELQSSIIPRYYGMTVDPMAAQRAQAYAELTADPSPTAPGQLFDLH